MIYDSWILHIDNQHYGLTEVWKPENQGAKGSVQKWRPGYRKEAKYEKRTLSHFLLFDMFLNR